MRRVEDTLRDALLVAIPRELAGARAFYRNIIDRHVIDPHTRREYHLKSGSKGMADVFIYVPDDPWAVTIEAELKAHDGRQSDEQKRWQTLMTNTKVPFLLLKQRAKETTEETIRRWISEIKLLIASLRPTPSSSTPPSRPSSTACPAAPRTSARIPATPSD